MTEKNIKLEFEGLTIELDESLNIDKYKLYTKVTEGKIIIGEVKND